MKNLSKIIQNWKLKRVRKEIDINLNKIDRSFNWIATGLPHRIKMGYIKNKSLYEKNLKLLNKESELLGYLR